MAAKKTYDKLTPEQEKQLEAWYTEWLKVGYSTERTNREAAERALTAMYKFYGYPKPNMHWFDSPDAMLNAAAAGSERPKRDCLSTSYAGVWELYWLCFYAFASKFVDAEIYEPKDTEELFLWIDVITHCHWFDCYDTDVFISDRPTYLTVDDRGFLHNESRMAIEYADGFGAYFWHNMRINQQLIEQPATITVNQIENETNVEIRRVMIERYSGGTDRADNQAKFLFDSGAVCIQQDKIGKLWKKELKDDPEALVMVEVLNSTPEPDGSIKTYFLRVPPTIKTAQEGIAWTFGMQESEYAPAVET